MKDTFKIHQTDTDVFESSCKDNDISFKLLTATKQVYEYEIEYKYACQLYYLGFMAGLKMAQRISKHL